MFNRQFVISRGQQLTGLGIDYICSQTPPNEVFVRHFQALQPHFGQLPYMALSDAFICSHQHLIIDHDVEIERFTS